MRARQTDDTAVPLSTAAASKEVHSAPIEGITAVTSTCTYTSTFMHISMMRTQAHSYNQVASLLTRIHTPLLSMLNAVQ